MAKHFKAKTDDGENIDISGETANNILHSFKTGEPTKIENKGVVYSTDPEPGTDERKLKGFGIPK